MKRLLHAFSIATVLTGVALSPGCALFVHETEHEKSGDASARVEHSESSKQTEVKDSGIGTSRTEVQMEHHESHEQVR